MSYLAVAVVIANYRHILKFPAGQVRGNGVPGFVMGNNLQGEPRG